VMNITDIEDKAILAAKREGISLRALEKKNARKFFSDFRKLGMLMPDVLARASDEIPQMVRLIQRICRKGHCRKERDGIYFDVKKWDYGRLCIKRKKKAEYLGVARKDDYSKEGMWDFRLWKFRSRQDGENYWSAPFGEGRPGWHIECSAIAMHHLGESFDIHCGGSDNIFPHHENEIAQSEAATGKRFANFWLHAKHLTIGGKKMSKRLGNVYYVDELERKGVGAKCLRFYLISERYRSRHDFTMKEFKKRIRKCGRIKEFISGLKKLRGNRNGNEGRKIAARLIAGFEKAMDDDLDTGRAFAAIFSTCNAAEEKLKKGGLGANDAKRIIRALDRIDSVLKVF
jgi:cysteinyl-tRNA synthetase